MKFSKAEFEQIYRRYSGPLFRYIYRFTADSQTAEEILHDIFIEVGEGRCPQAQTEAIKAWLYTVAKNKSLNFLKSKKIRNEKKFFLSDEIIPEEITEKIDSQLLNKELRIAESLLPNDLKSPWQLRKQGFDNVEIARLLAIPEGTVKSRFFRLVEFFRKELKDYV